jgi:hypothetical protein
VDTPPSRGPQNPCHSLSTSTICLLLQFVRCDKRKHVDQWLCNGSRINILSADPIPTQRLEPPRADLFGDLRPSWNLGKGSTETHRSCDNRPKRKTACQNARLTLHKQVGSPANPISLLRTPRGQSGARREGWNLSFFIQCNNLRSQDSARLPPDRTPKSPSGRDPGRVARLAVSRTNLPPRARYML